MGSSPPFEDLLGDLATKPERSEIARTWDLPTHAQWLNMLSV